MDCHLYIRAYGLGVLNPNTKPHYNALYLSCCRPIHPPGSSCLAGGPCAAGTSGTPSGPLSSPLLNPPDLPQALLLALGHAALGLGEGHAEGPGGKNSGRAGISGCSTGP